MSLFTPEELEELRLADEELEEAFQQTQEEIIASRKRDRSVKLERLDNKERKIAAQQAAYYEANREKIAAQQAAYREANREKIAAQQAAYREANREKWNAYLREYRRKKKAAANGANIDSGAEI